ncbi:MAG TPA: biotin carboxylase N-terminal domain-containing protein [Nocardioidaceae bacterium]|nr:biotin carboxylase N-terminal domain-containing protein [Nocardioidaceae bacterium]
MTTVLVANRGEIALRVMRSARAAGLGTVAVYSDADKDAPHVRAADVAVRIGPTPAAESYLDIDAIIGAARRSGADAVHPGYGFLSERAAFARAVTEAGLVFVGPPADVIDRMGRKDVALAVARAAGLPVLPQVVLGSGADGGSAAPAAELPLLVKAAAGGGGKGMRIVREPIDLEGAVASARREAKAAFGDDTVLLERYVEHGRHIEVQVLADAHGNVVHLFERDCSAQRRHQKVLEESPAPTIPEGVREQVTRWAVALAREVGYQSAGTVEFLLDADSGDAESGGLPDVYFLEMNTRLQVEHPVTESVVRVDDHPLDLVALQLHVAAGEPLPFTQDRVTVVGHAIEARVYAEDPFRGFLPQAGVAELVRWPTGVRVDHALEGGQAVSTAYDPMLGKVIAHGPDREAARLALVAALDRTAVLGLTTNTGFLRALVAGDAFRDAAIDTAWLDRTPLEEPPPDVARLFAAWVQAMLAGYAEQGRPFQADGWRLAGPPAPFLLELDRLVRVERSGDGTGRVDGVEVRHVSAEQHVAVLDIEGRREQAVVNAQPHSVEVSHRGQRHVFRRPDVFAEPTAASGDGSVTAPMPGTLLSVAVGTGQAVQAGDVLGVLEAMKMELSLTAPMAGTVSQVRAAGDRVALDDTVFVVTPDLAPADPAPSGSKPAEAPEADGSRGGVG